MNNKHIEAFRAVMMAGTVTGGSRLLNISQPAVSRLIAHLEAQLGFSLFSRHRGRLLPTADGISFYEEVQRSYVGLAKLAESAKAIKEFRQGQLRIGALSSLSSHLLPWFISSFNKKFSGVTYQIHVIGAERIRSGVANQQFHLGLVSLPVSDAAITAEFYVTSSLVCVVPPGHHLSRKQIVQPQDLHNEPLIIVPREYPLRLELEAACQKQEIQLNIKAETTTSMAACGLVQQGVGIAVTEPFTPLTLRKPDIIVRPFAKQFRFRFAVITPEIGEQPRLVRQFISQFRAFIEQAEFPKEFDIDLKIQGIPRKA